MYRPSAAARAGEDATGRRAAARQSGGRRRRPGGAPLGLWLLARCQGAESRPMRRAWGALVLQHSAAKALHTAAWPRPRISCTCAHSCTRHACACARHVHAHYMQARKHMHMPLFTRATARVFFGPTGLCSGLVPRSQPPPATILHAGNRCTPARAARPLAAVEVHTILCLDRFDRIQ